MTNPVSVFFDACTLQNFAVVDRLDLLEKRFAGRAGWTEGTAFEIRRGVREVPTLAPLLNAVWLGTPISVGDLPPEKQQVDRIRRAIGGGNARPLEHLGEAQVIHHLLQKPGAVFATDDRLAAHYANGKGIGTINSADILSDCFDADLAGCPEAFEVLRTMAQLGRGVAVPPSHLYVCP